MRVEITIEGRTAFQTTEFYRRIKSIIEAKARKDEVKVIVRQR